MVRPVKDVEETLEEIEKEIEDNKKLYIKWFCVIFLTIALPWSIWVTDACMRANWQQANLNQLVETIKEMMAQHKADMLLVNERFENITNTIDSLPPRDFRDRMTTVENGLSKNINDHMTIITALTKVESNQESMATTLNEVKLSIKELSKSN